MRDKRFRLAVEITCRFFLAVFFLLASSYKVQHPGVLAKALGLMPYIPELSHVFRSILAGAILGIEFYIGVALLFGFQRQLALRVAFCLPLALALLVAPVYESLGGDCGCVWSWVPFAPATGFQLALRNAVLGGLALLSLQLFQSRGGERHEWKGRPWFGLLATFALTVALWVTTSISPPPILQPCEESELPLDPLAGAILQPGDVHSGLIDASLSRVHTRHAAFDEKEIGTPSELALVVSQESGAPLQDARIMSTSGLISCRRSAWKYDLLTPSTPLATTGSKGRARLDAKHAQQGLIVLAEGFVPELIYLRPDLESKITLRALKAPLLIVEDQVGTAISEARVLLGIHGRAWPLPNPTRDYFDLGRTSAAGLLALPRSEREWQIGLVFAPGIVPGHFRYHSQDEGEIRVVLPEALPLPGRILGAEGRDNLFMLARPEDSPHLLPEVAEVGAHGRFRFESLCEATTWIVAPYTAKRTDNARVGDEVRIVLPCDPLQLTLTTGTHLRVLAVDARDQSPLSPTIYAAIFPPVQLADSSSPAAYSEADGSWHWPSLLIQGALPQELWVGADGFVPSFAGNHLLSAGSTVDLGTFELEASQFVRFRVLDAENHEPIPEAWVNLFTPQGDDERIWPQAEPTNAEGVATLPLPQEGETNLAVRKHGWVGHDEIVRVESLAQGHEILLSKGARIILLCTSQDGVPVSSAAIGWRGSFEQPWKTIYTSGRGEAEIFVPPGPVELKYVPQVLRGSTRGSELQIGDPATESIFEALQVPALSPGEERRIHFKVDVISNMSVEVKVDGVGAEGFRVLCVPGPSLDPTSEGVFENLSVARTLSDYRGNCALKQVPLGPSGFLFSDPKGRTFWSRRRVIQTDTSHLSFDLSTRELTIHSFHSDGTKLGGLAFRITSLPDGGIRLPRVAGRPGFGFGSGSMRATHERVLRTDDQGQLTLSGFSTESSLRIECADPSSFPTMEPVVLAPSEDSADVQLFDATGACLDVFITSPDGRPVEGYFLQLVSEETGASPVTRRLTSNSKGRIQFAGLEAGGWSLRGPRLDISLPISLRSGERRLVNLSTD